MVEVAGAVRAAGSGPRGWPGRLRAALRRRLAPAVLVLAYHRVRPERGRDANRLVTRTANFAEQLAWLAGRCRLLHLDELLAGLATGGRGWTLDGGRPRVLLTLDDGYADNLHHALPLLERFRVPATVFVSSALVGRREPFWWDALEQIVLDGARPAAWRLPDGRALPAGDDPAADFRGLHGLLRPLADGWRRRALAALAAQAGVAPQADEDSRPLSWDELRAWTGAGMTVGSHTRTHAHLASLDAAGLVAELAGGKRELEAGLGVAVEVLAYPYGGRADFDARCEQVARSVGFRAALAVGSGNVRWARSPYALPRCPVGDWSGAELAARVREWCS